MIRWDLINLLMISGDMITRTFIAFFIWEREQNIELILFYSLLYFGMIPLSSLISGIISDQIDSKIALLIGVWFQIIQITIIALPNFNLGYEMVAIVALAGGIGEGFRNIAIHGIEFKVRNDTNLAGYYANKTFFKKLIELLVPLTAAIIISATDSFQALFRLTVVLLVIKSIVIFMYKIPRATTTFDLKKIFTIPGTNPDKPVLMKGVFLEGLSDGVILTILPIIVLVFAESILNWGFINTGVVLFGVLVSLLIARFVNDFNSKVLYALGAFIFASASIIFITQYNLVVILLFLMAHSVMEIIKEVGYHSSIDRIMEKDRKEYELYTEYQFLVELIGNIGRIIPIAILVYIGFNINNEPLVRGTLIIIGLLPLISLSVLGKSSIFSSNPQDKLTTVRSEVLPTLDEETKDRS